MPAFKVNQSLYADLRQFSGSDEFHTYRLGKLKVQGKSPSYGPLTLAYTQGINYLCKQAHCYWLLDVIASHFNKVVADPRAETRHYWKIKADDEGGCTVSAEADGEVIVQQHIEHTDFPFPNSGEFRFPAAATTGLGENGEPENVCMLMLPSED